MRLTIAACHVSPEGVVLGADSTTTITNGDSTFSCHFDHAQKLFQVGNDGATVGLVTWGLGSIGGKSHRSLVNDLAMNRQKHDLSTIAKMAEKLGQSVGQLYQTSYRTQLEAYRRTIEAFEARRAPAEADLELAQRAVDLRGGYCIAGRGEADSECSAYTIEWSAENASPHIEEVPKEQPIFWGMPAFAERLIYGADSQLAAVLLKSGKWSGTDEELFDLLASRQLIHPDLLPLREAVDWIHTVIQTTIKAIKFAKQPHFCGGPIEIAVVTSDRPFRWVLHKGLDSAIG